jgi:hypothetical protein
MTTPSQPTPEVRRLLAEIRRLDRLTFADCIEDRDADLAADLRSR